MMEKNFMKNLVNKNKYIYFSMNSETLKHFKENIISMPKGTNGSAYINRDHISYKIILGKNLIRLSNFENSGYFDEKYDITFGFGMNFIFNQDYFVFNGNGLKTEEISDIDNLMKKIIRRKGKFEYGNDILVENLDLNMAAGIMYYTKEAKKNIKEAGVHKKIIQFDLIKERRNAIDYYQEFDSKVANGKITEFDWNKNEVLLQNIK